MAELCGHFNCDVLQSHSPGGSTVLPTIPWLHCRGCIGL